ncbi:hypothetical protein BDW22DRAFT_1166104 [Trametopsis cervina]|nr:hypothetical protein BDW22DRAFT_1166104 [Trametopsis cervina]
MCAVHQPRAVGYRAHDTSGVIRSVRNRNRSLLNKQAGECLLIVSTIVIGSLVHKCRTSADKRSLGIRTVGASNESSILVLIRLCQ